MENIENKKTNWIICTECKGQGKKRQRLRKKIRIQYQIALEKFEKSTGGVKPPVRPKGQLLTCLNCSGSGLFPSEKNTIVDTENFPHIAIIGAGIGGVALAVACLHRGIPFTLFERDESFNSRSQGYGLTLQQASKAIEGLGIFSLKEGVISTKHVVHTTDGKIIGEWGVRKWMQSEVSKTYNKRTNIHIARQSLRFELLEQLGGKNRVQWGHQLVDIKEKDDVEISFLVNGEIKNFNADLVVGADGIRSSVRKILVGDETTPLRYLNCMVILGICPLSNLKNSTHPLLDSETVFQTANGNERIYIMPFSNDSVMWQLSFPISENEAKKVSEQGSKSLKEEAIRITPWHDPIPQIIAATDENLISGYPVYDRELLTAELLSKAKKITLIGDAAHPMSPFKGQGANQALLDALALAREISKECRPLSDWKKEGIRKNVLTNFEAEMIQRSATKVKDSAEAAEFLHSEIVLHKGDEPRGRCLKSK